MTFQFPSTLNSGEQNEISYINGLNPDGSVAAVSWWGYIGSNPHKWQQGGGAIAAGVGGGVVTYAFDVNSGYTAAQQQTVVAALTLWSDIANITFAPASSEAQANVVIYNSSSGANTIDQYAGGGAFTQVISASVNIPPDGVFGDVGSFTTTGGYGVDTVVHELGHLLGLGHGGPYNGTVNPATQQEAAYDSRLYSIMSYIQPWDSSAAYYSSYPLTGANWGTTSDYYPRDPYTPMLLDILAAQQIYGVSTSTAYSGGQTFGFNCNITDASRMFYDFTIDTEPVVTLFDYGTGNTLDLSGYNMACTVNLNPGAYSSVGGLTYNVAIAYGTKIDTVYGSTGGGIVVVNADNDFLYSEGGSNTVVLADIRADYTISYSNSFATIMNLSTGVQDNVDNFQYAQFADQTVALIAPLSVTFTGAAGNTNWFGVTNTVTNWSSTPGFPATGADVTIGAGFTVTGGTGTYGELSNGGTLEGFNLTITGGITNTGAISTSVGDQLVFSGDFFNSGTAQFDSDLLLVASNGTFDGHGHIILTTTNFIPVIEPAAASGATIDNVDNTISGYGDIANYAGSGTSGFLAFTNGGVIDGNNKNGALDISAGSATIATVNTGLLEATNGGSLTIESPLLDNAGGNILAADGSHVTLTGVRLEGGTLATQGSGVIGVAGATTFDSMSAAIDLNGAIAVNSGALTLIGSIANQGSLTLLSPNLKATTDLVIDAGGVTLTGGGKVVLTNVSQPTDIRAAAGTTATAVLTNQDNIISGIGEIGASDTSSLEVINHGTIVADQAAGQLVIDAAGGVTNYGSIRATGAAGMEILNTKVDSSVGGTLVAAAGSHIDLNFATLKGGASAVGTGYFQAIGASFSSTLDGTATTFALSGRLDDVTGLVVEGAIANSGEINVFSANALQLVGQNVTLTGGGSIVLDGSGAAISNYFAPATLTNQDNVISGAGLLSNLGAVAPLFDWTFQNAGTVDANVAGQQIVIETGTQVLNNGQFEADGGELVVDDAVTGSGSVLIKDGGSAQFSASFQEATTFAGAGELELAQAYGGKISGFGSGDAIGLEGFDAAATESVSGNVLTVVDGALNEALTFSSGATFTTAEFGVIQISSGGMDTLSLQTSFAGGGYDLDLAGGSSSVAMLSGTAGNWDTVHGSGGAVYLTSAQANVMGGGDKINFVGGAGNAVSLSWTGGVATYAIAGFVSGDTINLNGLTSNYAPGGTGGVAPAAFSLAINGNVVTQTNADGSRLVSTFNIAGQTYKETVAFYSPANALVSVDFIGLGFQAGDYAAFTPNSSGPGGYLAIDNKSATQIASFAVATSELASRFTVRSDGAGGLLMTDESVPEDFNGDGASDILLQNPSTDALSDRLIRSGAISAANALGTPSGYSVVGTGDFTGDGTSDLLLENKSSGALVDWIMGNGVVTGGNAVGVAPAGWSVAGTGDFFGAGTDDLLLENASSGAIVEWTMANGVISGASQIGVAAGYSVVGTGDFNGDGTTDILLRNSSTGGLVDWILNDGVVTAAHYVGAPPAGYSVVGTGDFKGNGVSDILLENSSTGAIVDWILTNGVVSGSALVGTAAGYQVAGTGDYNGDGTSDILLQNSSGALVAWTIANSVVTGGDIVAAGAAVGSVYDGLYTLPAAKPAVADDFTGGGTSDILLQNSAGALVDWIVANGAITAGNNLGIEAGWSVAGTGDFNGDGTADILLQNGGNVVDWSMKNGVVSGGALVGNASGYAIVGSGDFTGNGTSDILLQNSAGALVDWIMGNGAVTGANALGTATGYNVVGTGDFTGNGTDDVLLESSAGTVVDWTMQNGVVSGGAVVGNASGYNIVGTGDFTGNGTSDILLQNSAGALVDWIMGNGAVSAAHYLGTAAGWTVAAIGDYTGNGVSDILLTNGGNAVDWTMANGVVSGASLIGNTAGFAVKH